MIMADTLIVTIIIPSLIVQDGGICLLGHLENEFVGMLAILFFFEV